MTTPPLPEPSPPSVYVTIGLREIYDAVVHTSAQVALVSNQLMEVTRRQTEAEQRTDARFQEFDDELEKDRARIQALERTRWPLQAVSVLIAAAALVYALLRGK